MTSQKSTSIKLLALCLLFLNVSIVSSQAVAADSNGSMDQYPDDDSESSSALPKINGETSTKADKTKTETKTSNTVVAQSTLSEDEETDTSATVEVVATSQAFARSANEESVAVETATKKVATNTEVSETSIATAGASDAVSALQKQKYNCVVDSRIHAMLSKIESETTSKAAKATLASTTVTSNTASATGTCGAEWAQCGGEDFTGKTCCQSGLKCVSANSWWARCVSESTMNTASSLKTVSGSVVSVTGSDADCAVETASGSDSSSGTISTSVTSSLVSTTYDTTYVTTVTLSDSSYQSTVSSHVTTYAYKAVSSVVTVNGAAANIPIAIFGNTQLSTKVLIYAALGFCLYVAGI
ncbi:hypothetical protein HII12_002995 [Brettanomyces bruxellensis]|uniref:CBM1 domain-containing protein n=1 Tax=Dekkera bruxellensis TaxID=5007 RepID=A0A8H6BEN6_DEKBR|nr:hypothetical protein HII12_002995 [Brettanomyces bruxellensis]